MTKMFHHLNKCLCNHFHFIYFIHIVDVVGLLYYAFLACRSHPNHVRQTAFKQNEKKEKESERESQKANSHLLSGIHIEHITNNNMTFLNRTNKSYSNGSYWKMDIRLPCICQFWTICNRIGFQWCRNQMHGSFNVGASKFQSNLSCVCMRARVRYDLYAVHINFIRCSISMLSCSLVSFEFQLSAFNINAFYITMTIIILYFNFPMELILVFWGICLPCLSTQPMNKIDSKRHVGYCMSQHCDSEI